MKTVSLLILLCVGSLTSAQEASTEPVPPPFKVMSQPDAPAHVVSAKTKWALPDDRRGVEVYVVVENASQKPISMYTTRRESSNDGTKSCLGPPRLSAKGLLPGEKAGTSTWQRVPDANAPPAVWVDFVEFTDGSRWGADECQMGESIDGERSGARMQRDQLLEVFRQEGPDASMTFIKENYKKTIDMKAWKEGERPVLPIAAPPGHSRRWEEGFSTGARSVVERIIEAERKWGSDEIEHELSRPIGPAEKKSP
jgi:hypothetical protein